jgi:hypothetical protein
MKYSVLAKLFLLKLPDGFAQSGVELRIVLV